MLRENSEQRFENAKEIVPYNALMNFVYKYFLEA